MAVKKKQAVKKKAAPKKKAVKFKKSPGRPGGKLDPQNKRHKRNKNNLTEQEQAFADLMLENKEGRTATELIIEIHPSIKRPSARTKASVWMADERITAYMDIVRQRVEDSVEYGLVQWRKDVLDLIEIGMGRKEREQYGTIKNEDGTTIKIQLEGVKEFEGNVAKGALELIAKQMKLLTDKTEVDVGDQLREIFSKVSPTTGPPCIRDQSSDE